MRSRPLLLVIVVFLAGLAVGWLAPIRGGDGTAAAEPPPVASNTAATAASPHTLSRPPVPDGISDDERRIIEVFRQASQSVVYLTSIALRRSLFSFDVMQIPQGSGSGFVWDKEGHIVTNYHVISAGNRVQVTLADQTEWAGEVIGVAPNKDVAVVKIEAPVSHLEPLAVGRSANLVVGQRVLAIGNPFGLDHSLTVGVVSALGRELQSPGGRIIRDVIQSDAAINPGNSGGPLLNSSGRLVGMNTAIYSPSGASAGIGFAVPVDTVSRLVPQLIKNGQPVQPGIGFQPLDDRYAQRLGVEGVVVQSVFENGPADQAGLLGITTTRKRRYVIGDIIVAVNGEPVKNLDDLTYKFEAAGVGATVELTVLRDKKERTLSMTLVPLHTLER